MNTIIPHSKHPRIVVIGGGFGGIEFCKKLKNKNYQIVLIDKHNYHTFQPLLYQVATGGLEAESIAFPLRKIFKGQDNLIFRVAKVNKVDTQNNLLHTTIGEIAYDYLVIATGSTSNFFGQENIERNSMPMKSIPEALNLRSIILQNLESALIAPTIEEKNELLNFVVVGGGPTGVETAGALGELKKHVLPNDYPELDLNSVNIFLVEGSDKLLSTMSANSSKKSKEFLEEMGVNVMLNTRVENYDGKTLFLIDQQPIHSATVIWSAGVKGVIVDGFSSDSITRGNRLIVDGTSKVKGYSNVYAIGDVAAMLIEDFPNGHPGVAQVAIQQGKNLAKLFATHTLNNAATFKYNDKGSMATVGRNRAVVDLNKIRFQGIFAWFTWMFVHLMTLAGFRNKLVVFVNWVWSYISYDRGTRLIIRSYDKKTRNVNTH